MKLRDVEATILRKLYDAFQAGRGAIDVDDPEAWAAAPIRHVEKALDSLVSKGLVSYIPVLGGGFGGLELTPDGVHQVEGSGGANKTAQETDVDVTAARIAERNANARRVIAYFHAKWVEGGSPRLWSIRFDDKLIEDLGLTRAQYRTASDWLMQNELLRQQGMGNHVLTKEGIDAAEDAAMLDDLLPIEPPNKVRAKEPSVMPLHDPRNVFVIHGRDSNARVQLEHFLKALGLHALDFDELAADLGATHILEIVKQGMERAQGIVALFTPDEWAELRADLRGGSDTARDHHRWQARPNVLFEAGMAFAMAPERTIIAVIGGVELFSDIAGVHYVQLSNDIKARGRFRQKLIGVKCAVDQRSEAWTDPARAGDFSSAPLPSRVAPA